jgi:ubiquinone/menaquinone biosynthesis C-methylase UbiE
MEIYRRPSILPETLLAASPVWPTRGQWLWAAVRPGPGIRVLDLGGGNGRVTETFGEGADEIVVLDPEDRKLQSGSLRNPRIRFVRGVAERLPFSDASFQRVTSVRALHHFHDPGLALGEARRVLAPGGSLVICDIRPHSLLARIFGTLHRLSGHGPLSFLTPEELGRKVIAAGFSSFRNERRRSESLLRAER